MPRDLPIVRHPPSAAALPSESMRPVPAPAQVWAVARKAFGVEPIEQFPLRARFLDVLEHLNRGHPLALLGVSAPAVWLDGYPDIALLAGVLFTYGYVEIAGRHRDNPAVVYFMLSEAGLRKLREGRAWWNTLSFWQRLRVRLFG
jgi:hypothetical protein